MQGFKTRDALSNDIPVINSLFNEAGQLLTFLSIFFSFTLLMLVEEDVLEWNTARPLEFHQVWFKKMDGYPCLVVEDLKAQIVAFGALEPQSTCEGSSFMFNTNLIICVSAAYRRQGIAKTLWAKLCAHDKTYDRSIYVVHRAPSLMPL